MNSKIKDKIIIYFLLLGIIPMITVMTFEYFKHVDVLKARSFEQLKLVRGIKQREIESFFANSKEKISMFSQDKVVIEAMQRFKNQFKEVSKLPLSDKEKRDLSNYYTTTFKNKINNPLLDTNSILSLVPQNPATIKLQSIYLAGEKEIQNLSGYDVTHNEFHSKFLTFTNCNNYSDILLIDNVSGDIVYSVKKEIDFGTNVLTDSDSKLSELFKKSRNNRSDQVFMTDYFRYIPDCLNPMLFIAAPIVDNNKTIGIIVIKMSNHLIDQITTNQKIWKEDGLGNTGECYILGSDRMFRTNSRFIIETPTDFFKQAHNAYIDSSEFTKMKQLQSTALIQIKSPNAENYSKGSGLTTTTDYRNKEVLSAYATLNIPDVNWTIFAEMDVSEVFLSLNDYRIRSISIVSFLALLIMFIAYYLAKSIYDPVTALLHGAKQLEDGNLNITVSVESKDEFMVLANCFNRAICNLRTYQENIKENNKLLGEQKEEILSQSDRLMKLNAEITENNLILDKKVAERTEELLKINHKLYKYAFFNSHKLRSPVASILGLINLFKITASEEERLKCIELLHASGMDLDNVIHELQKILDTIEIVD